MRDIIRKISDWFSAERRQAIYTGVAAIAATFVSLGSISNAESEAVLVLTSAALQTLAGIMMLFHLRPSQVGSWISTAGRATIYGLAATAAPAAVTLGLLTEQASVNVLTWISVVLTVIASTVGVIMIQRQEVRGGDM